MDTILDHPEREEFLPFFRPAYDGSTEEDLIVTLRSGVAEQRASYATIRG